MMPESLTPRSGKVDIFTVHTRLNIEEHKKVMPPDTIYITSVRDPITMLESIFNYFYLKKFYKTDFPGFVLNWNLTVSAIGLTFKCANSSEIIFAPKVADFAQTIISSFDWFTAYIRGKLFNFC